MSEQQEGVAGSDREAPRDRVRTAGRGLLSITAAKIYFIFAAYAVQLLLPRLWPEETFGLYSTAMQTVSILNNVLIAATVQSVSKLVSERDELAGPTLRQGLRIQLVVGGLLGGGLFLAAPVLAEGALLDAQLTPLLRVAATVVVAYALYAALVGSLNGRHLFQRQAGLDATFSTLRTTGIVGAAALGFGAFGALSGFASAAVSILLVALLVVGLGSKGERRPLKRWLLFMAPLWVYHMFLNLVLMSDLLVLKRSVAELSLPVAQHVAELWSLGQEASSSLAAQVANRHAGFYRAAQTFAFVPYQLILSMTFIVFPMVSRAMSEGDVEATRTTIRGAMRFSLLTLLAVASPLAGAADGVMRLAYPPEYLAGAPALGVLVFGLVMFALFVISATILNGAGRPAVAAVIASFALVVVVAANRLLVMAVGVGEHTLRAAAAGTTLGMAIAMLAAGTAVYRSFQAWLPPASVARGVVAGAAAYAVAHFVPHDSPLMALVALAAGFFAYLLALVLVRELRGKDLEVAKRVLKKR